MSRKENFFNAKVELLPDMFTVLFDKKPLKKSP